MFLLPILHSWWGQMSQFCFELNQCVNRWYLQWHSWNSLHFLPRLKRLFYSATMINMRTYSERPHTSNGLLLLPPHTSQNMVSQSEADMLLPNLQIVMFWTKIAQKRQKNLKIQILVLPDVDFTKIAKSSLFYCWFWFWHFLAKPHLVARQNRTIWRFGKNMSDWTTIFCPIFLLLSSLCYTAHQIHMTRSSVKRSAVQLFEFTAKVKPKLVMMKWMH